MVQLPRIVALKSKYNNMYLRYLNEDSSPLHQFLRYSEEEILTPYTKFEFEPAKSDPSLFHIRCCYNNKYLCSLLTEHTYIVASANQKDEDQTQWTCTLFRPDYDDEHHSFRFCHVYLGFNIVLWRHSTHIYGRCLRALWRSPDSDLCDLSTIINWESLVSLPKFLAFKSNDVGLYLSAHFIERVPYLHFSSNNIEDSSVQMETLNTNDGSICINSSSLGRFWRRASSNWIFADSADFTTQTPDTLFWPIKLDSTTVALRSLGNNNIVKRITFDGRTDHLGAGTREIDSSAHLRMEELVRSREIYDVTFHLSDARIRDEVVHVVATGTTTNYTKVPNPIDLSVSYADTTSSTLTSSISTKFDVKTTLKFDIPRIVLHGKEIKISETIFSGGYKWGETITTSKTGRITYQVIVPPMNTVSIKVLATKGTCDVPFSYKQRDILIGGKIVEYSLNDGVYCGTNYYTFSKEYSTKPIE